jgi:hypothetical protein
VIRYSRVKEFSGMTLAICWKCGSQKVGALTLCAGCAAVPVEPVDKAVSVLLSDHYQTEAELVALAEAIRRGEPPRFDEADLERVLSVVRKEPGLPWGCTVAVWLPVVALVLLAIVVVGLYVAGVYR